MCGVLHRNLGKGARCALPLHPSGLGSSWVLNPSRAIRTFRRSITLSLSVLLLEKFNQ